MVLVRRILGIVVVVGTVLTLLTIVSAYDWGSSSGGGSPSPVALPTYGADTFTGNRACGGIGLDRLLIRFGPDGVPEGYLVDASGRQLKGPLVLVWPPGYTFDRQPGGTIIVSQDKTIRIPDGATLEDVGDCPMADGRHFIGDPGHLMAP